MSYEEKGVWAYLTAAVGSFAVYVAVVLRRADGVPLQDVQDVAYVAPMLWTIAVSVGVSVAVRVVLEIVRPSDTHLADARDKEIGRYGDWLAGFVLAVGAAGVLALALLRADHFWIANGLYAVFVLQAVVASVVKLRAYEVGF